MGWQDNGISVRLNYIKKKSDALDRFAKIVKYFPHEKMLEFFNQFPDEYFKNVKAVVDALVKHRRRK